MAKWPYSTSRWKKIRLAQLRRYPICTHCRMLGVAEAATEVDHVTPINQGGSAWSPANHQSLCRSHHSQKTNDERAGRAVTPRLKGCHPDGTPLDPSHHWNRGKIAQNRQPGDRRDPSNRLSSGDLKWD